MTTDKYYESHIKCDFLNYLRAKKIINAHSLIASEYVLGTTGRRADLAIYSRTKFIGIEVKSQYDTLTRLRDQLKVYTACFDEVMIVLDGRHIEEGLKIASADVAVFEAGRKGDISLRRAAVRKPQIDSNTQLQLLPVQELKKLAGYCLNASAKRNVLIDQVANLPEDVISNAIAEAFKRTFSDTSKNFWQHVKRKRITPETLCHLSRFASARINLREKLDEKTHFWDAWRQHASIALKEAAA